MMSHQRNTRDVEGPVAVVGLTAMGHRIADRPHGSDRSLVARNHTAGAVEPLVRRGASAAMSPAGAATLASTVVVMVSAGTYARLCPKRGYGT